MKLTITPASPSRSQKWPRLFSDTITGTIYLIPSLEKGTQAIDIQSGHLHLVDHLLNNLEELPAGYSVTLTNE